jgi:Zn finger protein HypA/HybF involved in hydrogenase expression
MNEDKINKLKIVHNNIYDYSKAIFISRLSPIIIICSEHGDFNQTYAAHLKGQGCPKCGAKNRHKNKKVKFEEFLRRAKLKHGDKFIYENHGYDGIESVINIKCQKHGSFSQVAKTHIKSSGCPKCGNESKSSKLSLTKEKFIEKSEAVHDKKFNYNLVNYINNATAVKIICNFHGEFMQKPMMHLQGNGCPKCGGTQKSNTEEFIEKSKLIHGDKYEYDNVKYLNSKLKVLINCKKHGIFPQSPSHHLLGSGCPTCKDSRGEKYIKKILKEKKIIFESQKKFKDCINTKTGRELSFDFYLPDFNICIEYDGEQHFVEWRLSSKELAKEKLKKIKFRDELKTIYCYKKNISLLRIKFDEDPLVKINQYLNDYKSKTEKTN